MLIISVAWIGPPPVVIQTSGNTCIVQMKSSSAMLMMIGISCGRVTCQNFWQLVGAIDVRGLVELLGDALKAGQQRHHVERISRPDVDEGQRVDGGPRRREPLDLEIDDVRGDQQTLLMMPFGSSSSRQMIAMITAVNSQGRM